MNLKLEGADVQPGGAHSAIKKFKSMKELNDHVMEHQKYRFLCKYHHCRKSYSSKVSADHHVRHHSPGHYQCDKFSKMFHEKYTLEAHLNTHSKKGYEL